MTETFEIGARPRPYLLPRLRVAGDLLRFEACPLRYRMHGVGAWPEADAEDAPRLAGMLVHAALDHAGTACRPMKAGGQGMPVDAVVASRAVGSGQRLVDAESPRASRSVALQGALDAAATLARRTILILGPHLFPYLAATEQRVAATRRQPDYMPDEVGGSRRLRKVERFEVSGVLDALATGLVPDPDGDPFLALIHGALKQPGVVPVDAVIDYKLARRPRTSEVGSRGATSARGELEAHLFQVAAYARIRDQFAAGRARVGIVIYLNDLLPELDSRHDTQSGPDLGAERGAITDDEWRLLGDAPSVAARLHRASTVIELDDDVIAEATARIDRIAAAIEACAEHEAASVPPRLAWPTRRSALCGDCDVRPMCPEWQDAGESMPGGAPKLGYAQGELDDG